MSKCMSKNCKKSSEEQFKHCKKCLTELLKICTCDKIFIIGIPDTILVEKEYFNMPDPVPEYFFKQISGNIYGIQCCRGCKYTESEVLKDSDKAIRVSISSCVYQKIGDKYEYMSDALDPAYEEKLISLGINLGNPVNIKVSF